MSGSDMFILNMKCLFTQQHDNHNVLNAIIYISTNAPSGGGGGVKSPSLKHFPCR